MSNDPTNHQGQVPEGSWPDNQHNAGSQNPYGTAPTDPYAASAPQSDPYGTSVPQSDPYGTAPADPYGQQAGYVAPGAGYGQPAYGYQPGAATPQLSSWFKRVAANIIDSIPGAILGGIASNFMPDYDQNTGAQLTDGNWPVAMVFLALAFGWTLWNRWLRAGRTGQSVGKSVLGIKLLDEMTGQPIGAGKAFLRDICHVLDNICYIGYLWPLWDAKRQTFADKIMKTVVVDAK
ncbi:RDD family protein [Luteococcus peritonei]|uniref:RDD family protein n=1 Tax=Luteococcus peritonei TaxID=88874 RepID=A0ABW4RRP4_9ACTN